MSMENTGRLKKNPALKWAMQITCKLINLALKWVIITALKCPYVLLNLALKCPAPIEMAVVCWKFPPTDSTRMLSQKVDEFIIAIRIVFSINRRFFSRVKFS